jgi:S1-C subfamily serine protease
MNVLRSHFAASVIGGLVVAGGFLAFGIIGQRTTQTIVAESPMASVTAAGAGLTPHAIYLRDAPSVVFVRAKLAEVVRDPFRMFHQLQSTSTGSGFLVDRRGDILTDYHVIDGALRSGVTVEFDGGVVRNAAVVGVDPAADLAVLRVGLGDVGFVRPLALGDSTTVRVGDPTLTIGNPAGSDRTLTTGIVSALQHQIEASDGTRVDNVIQTEQPIDPSTSGGPLLNGAGRVIGVNSQVASVAGDGMAVSFATPIDTVVPILALVRHGDRVGLGATRPR